ncbi:hypothetical protein KO500_07585 [Cellulophaga baltica]|uniref:hypothetical protein n=1 Tax=Cellulophaga TaxID=104264 RepID=UPI001C072F31|nr:MULTISPECIES: hypothetical protein [Cellulophaga]MBU2996291.1 hypothetical protein [Cellulophaga baltica]MDO6767686.1 hypothetical protein [Cellulophaga sp. 1_MG-2023]
MITENKNLDKDRTYKGLDNNVQQNRSLEQEPYLDEDTTTDNIGNPVNNGGVDTSIEDINLEKQWLAVRDEYLAHYPNVADTNTTSYDKGNFNLVIDSIAHKTKRTPTEIHHEIMNWSPKK